MVGKRMSLISLNTWGGAAGRGQISHFFETYAAKTDIFCLQEMYNRGPLIGDDPRTIPHLAEVITRLLPKHQGVFMQHTPLMPGYGMVVYVRKDMRILDGHGFLTSAHLSSGAHDLDHDRMGERLILDKKHVAPFAVMNIHGLWHPAGRVDCTERSIQSQRILRMCESWKIPTILAGDFNVPPELECMQMLTRAGFRNLVSEYGITDTRTPFYEKPDRYADYVLVSPGVIVHSFEVLPDVVSDHAALRLVFEVV